jgi:hypothetical protein
MILLLQYPSATKKKSLVSATATDVGAQKWVSSDPGTKASPRMRLGFELFPAGI